jgi:hypothetical protein
MREDELRDIVSEAVARHLGRPAAAVPAAVSQAVRVSPSHARLPVEAGSVAYEGRCLIEPAVLCTHCGYCQSYGH